MIPFESMSHLLYEIGTLQKKPIDVLMYLVKRKSSFWLVGITLRFIEGTKIELDGNIPLMEYVAQCYTPDPIPEIFYMDEANISFQAKLALDKATLNTFQELIEAVQAQAIESIRKPLYKFSISDWEHLISLCIQYYDFATFDMLVEILGFPYYLSSTFEQLLGEYQLERNKATELWKIHIFKKMIEKAISFGACASSIPMEFKEIYEKEPLWKK